MANPKKTPTSTDADEVLDPGPVRRPFVTSVEASPEVVARSIAKLNPKTLAERAAGKEALAQYAPTSE